MSEALAFDLAVAWKLAWFGMLVVFAALGLVSVAVSLFRFLDAVPSPHHAAHGAGAQGPAPSPQVEEGIPSEVVAAISAALIASLGQKTRIHRIRYRRGSPEPTWSRQGRISIMASHRTR